MNNTDNNEKRVDVGPFYHGTKVALTIGDKLRPGFPSNYLPHIRMNHVYFSATLSAAALAAELAEGEGEPQVYEVCPLGTFEDDPNLTNQRFPGNPTRSYRSASPVKIVGIIHDWPKLTPEAKKEWQAKIKQMREDSSTHIFN